MTSDSMKKNSQFVTIKVPPATDLLQFLVLPCVMHRAFLAGFQCILPLYQTISG